jgi:hypothetical protein
MGKSFWFVYFLAATALLAATWRFAPAVGGKLPADARASIRAMVAKCMGRAVVSAGSEASAVPAPVDAAATSPAERKPVSAAAHPSAEEDDLPSLRGVVPVAPRKAKWGVLNRETEVVALDGQMKGSVAGGRFFLVEKCEVVANELWLVGDFTPKGLGEKVRVNAKNLHCFTGAPGLLSENQRKCLRMYYQLRGEAQARKEEVMREIASRSPYAADAAAAVAAFRARAKEVDAVADADDEAKRKATYELARLRSKVQELNESHRTWKRQHASELPDPEKDSKYLKLLDEARQYASPIVGMTF